MKTLLEKLLKFLGLLVLIIVVSLIPELIGGNIAEYLQGKLGEHYFWILAGTGLVALLFVTLWTEGDKIFKKKKGEPTAEAVSENNLQKIRAGLLESYQERLKSKLAARFPINLELKYSTEGANVRKDILDNKNIRSTKIKEELIELFDKHRGRLLIIGEPGAGKTTLLLQLAEQLMEREERQIPVVINMATWRERFSSVEEWLQELLPQMGFSKDLATQFLQDDVLLPLFDGLDELGEDLRKPCLEAIGEYGKKQEIEYVICSRIVEYAQTVDAPVYCQIMVKPLTLTQIREGLKEVNSPETNGILDAMKKDPLLREAIKTPFYLNTVQLLFAASKVWEEFDFKAETLEGRQQEIVEFFVANTSSSFEKYPSSQVKKWLGFLADRMNWKTLVKFELRDLQYDWWQFKTGQIFFAKFIEGLVNWLVKGPVMMLLLGLLIWLVNWLAGGPIGGVVFGLLGGLVSGGIFGGLGGAIGGIGEKFEDENRFWSFKFFGKHKLWDKYLTSGLFGGLLFGLLFGLFGGLFGGMFGGLFGGMFGGLSSELADHPVRIETRDSVNWSFSSLIRSFKESLFAGLILSLVLGSILWLIDGSVDRHITGSVIALVYILISGLSAELTEQLANSISFLKVTRPYQRFKASMWTLHFSILQHYHLRRLLCNEGSLPKKLVTFLKQATTHQILESDGGSWRFRHRILQEYFAEHWEAVYETEFPRGGEEENKN